MIARPQAGLAVSSSAGFAVGGLTVAGVYAFYPPVRGNPWPIPAVAVTSILSMLLLYLVLARFGWLRAGDWLVVGYALALVVAAGLVITRELVETLRAHAPESLGVAAAVVLREMRRG